MISDFWPHNCEINFYCNKPSRINIYYSRPKKLTQRTTWRYYMSMPLWRMGGYSAGKGKGTKKYMFRYETLTWLSILSEVYRILAWKMPWTEEPGRLLSMGSQRVGYDWTHTKIKRISYDKKVVNTLERYLWPGKSLIASLRNADLAEQKWYLPGMFCFKVYKDILF